MQRCLISKTVFDLDEPLLEGDSARHLHTVLRIGRGEKITLLDGEGRRKEAIVAESSRHAVRVTPCGSVESTSLPRPRITLFQCVIKNTRMDWVVEKAVELGVSTLVPVIARHSVVKHEEGTVNDRWQRIADGALEQCGGAWRMEVAPVHGFASALPMARGTVPTFIAALSPDATPIRDAFPADAPERIGWFVGPEGDFSEEELRSLCSAGATPVTLGKNILRSETAAMFGLCAIRTSFYET